MRIMAIDYGDAHTGIAISDPTGFLAGFTTTINAYRPEAVADQVASLAREHGVEELVRDAGARVYPVGRLDMDSEGLLLLTNDGAFANALMHPRHEVEKTYDVWVTGYTPGGERRLAKPIPLDGYTIRPPKVKLLKAEGQSAKLRVTIHEGRNRQVRRMCDAAGMHCTRLRRIQEGSLRLGDLPLGKWRYLTEAEVAGLVRTPGTSGTI